MSIVGAISILVHVLLRVSVWAGSSGSTPSCLSTSSVRPPSSCGSTVSRRPCPHFGRLARVGLPPRVRLRRRLGPVIMWVYPMVSVYVLDSAGLIVWIYPLVAVYVFVSFELIVSVYPLVSAVSVNVLGLAPLSLNSGFLPGRSCSSKLRLFRLSTALAARLRRQSATTRSVVPRCNYTLAATMRVPTPTLAQAIRYAPRYNSASSMARLGNPQPCIAFINVSPPYPQPLSARVTGDPQL
ncbi:hypothetical protein FN846DRAFT_886134 [Sphaerosporella brunnea]|uniref:Uncharacterized protein n=1 Tax=Sphaerosporella brunnea TaxID=1250544 RepID=A0A5J5FAJ3_9PEZI|nr:hypothetical protein FN846DRAFT_886134 [Sphaerosporella brunnea]